jgi:hypothetical protein
MSMFRTKGEATTNRSSTADEEPTTDGAFSEDGVDLTVIRWMLDLTPTERLQAAQDLIDAASALRSGGGDDP